MGDPITSLDGLEGKTVEINAHVESGKMVDKLVDQYNVEHHPTSDGRFFIEVTQPLTLTPVVKSLIPHHDALNDYS